MTRRRLLVLALAMCGCPGVTRPLERPRCTVRDVEAAWRAGGELVLRVRLEATNADGVALSPRALDWELAIAGGPPWRGRSELGGALPARATVPVEVVLTVPAAVAGDMVARMQSGARDYILSGTMHLASERGELAAGIFAMGELTVRAQGLARARSRVLAAG